MGNEQQGGTSHHFLPDHQGQKGVNGPLWTRNGRISNAKQQPASIPLITSKPPWQLTRDASMDILSRKTTKLSVKQGPTPVLPANRSVLKKYPPQEVNVNDKPRVVYQTPRMPTDKDISRIMIAYQLLCSFCEGPCIGDYLRCRVCIKAYHCQCLSGRGYLPNPSFSLPRMGKQDWSCPECKDLSRILSQEEMNYLIALFEQIDRNKNGFIGLEEYVYYLREKHPPDHYNLLHEKLLTFEKQYQLMDSSQKGQVDWSDFVLFYSCRLIASKNKTFLTTKLTEKELAFAKNLFFKDPKIQMDAEGTLICTQNHLNRIIYELTLMLKKKYGGEYIDGILHDFYYNNDVIEKYTVFGWDEFLRQLSILILLNRSNYDVMKRSSSRLSMTKPHLISHTNLTTTETDVTKKLPPIKTETINVSSSIDSTINETFRKHEKILEKLQQREEEKKKSPYDWSIVENLDDDDENLPKLKVNGRDQRQSVTHPWVMVKEMQQLRNEPILIKSTHVQVIRV